MVLFYYSVLAAGRERLNAIAIREGNAEAARPLEITNATF